MFTPNPGMSHLDYNRLLPAVYAPSSFTPAEKQAGPKKDIQSSKLHITEEQDDILNGTLLGDASMATENGGKTFRLRLVQGKNHADYFHHLVSHFEHFGKTGPKINPANDTYYWNSLQSDSFRFYGQRFYKQIDEKKFQKKVPANVKQWLTPRAATYWFLDDGSAKDKKTTTAFRLCTDSFTRSDVERLAEALEANFDIKTSIYENRPNQYRIYCKAPSVASFWDQVIPILQKEIQPTAPQILTKLPQKIYNQVIDVKQPEI